MCDLELFSKIQSQLHISILLCITHILYATLQCICIQGIDVKSMGHIFIGLVKCGAWGCFDEFNRLEEAVLSAVSMQIQTIQASTYKEQRCNHRATGQTSLNAYNYIKLLDQ